MAKLAAIFERKAFIDNEQISFNGVFVSQNLPLLTFASFFRRANFSDFPLVLNSKFRSAVFIKHVHTRLEQDGTLRCRFISGYCQKAVYEYMARPISKRERFNHENRAQLSN